MPICIKWIWLQLLLPQAIISSLERSPEPPKVAEAAPNWVSRMFFPRIVLLLKLISLAFCHWMCDSAGISCDVPFGSEKCFTFYFNAWLTTASYEVLQLSRSFLCSAVCLEKNCQCALFVNGEKNEIEIVCKILSNVLE